MREQLVALRTSAAWTRAVHVSCVRVSGADAYQAVDAACTAELFLRDTQMRSALLLDDDAHIMADVFVCRDDDDMILLAEGLSAPEVIAHIRDSAPASLQFDAIDCAGDMRMLSLNGPFAWEVAAGLIGPEVVGLPYLSLLRLDDGYCFRGGKTGEFGFDLLLHTKAAAALLDRLHGMAGEFDMVEADVAALDHCALENWFFNIRHDAGGAVTPLELQLQWRVSRRKQYRGAAALLRRLEEGIARRVTMLVAEAPVHVGADVLLDDRVIGTITNAAYSPFRAQHVALAMLDTPYASSGISAYRVLTDGAAVPIRTISPPAINNRSLHVSPQLHSYRTRDEFTFPDLAAAHATDW